MKKAQRSIVGILSANPMDTQKRPNDAANYSARFKPYPTALDHSDLRWQDKLRYAKTTLANDSRCLPSLGRFWEFHHDGMGKFSEGRIDAVSWLD